MGTAHQEWQRVACPSRRHGHVRVPHAWVAHGSGSVRACGGRHAPWRTFSTTSPTGGRRYGGGTRIGGPFESPSQPRAGAWGSDPENGAHRAASYQWRCSLACWRFRPLGRQPG